MTRLRAWLEAGGAEQQAAAVLPRFRLWLESTGWSQGEAGTRLGCKQAHVSYIVVGDRLPGRMIANAIERESASWPSGPITSEEWDRLERALDAAAPISAAS